MKILKTFAALALGAMAGMALAGPGLAQDGQLIVIITPSHDNPFFKAEAEGAKARAEELGLYDPGLFA